MFKKTIAMTVTASIIFSGFALNSAFAEPGKDKQIIPIIVNGQKVKFPDTEPYISTTGSTMVPIRFVSEKLGADVKWDNTTQTATLLYQGKTIKMSIGSITATVDDVDKTLDTAAEMYDGRTMVPLRFVSEVLGSQVTWDPDAHSVQVTDADYQSKVEAGTVKLDPWGREYSKGLDADWIKLADLESYGFYKSADKLGNSRAYLEKTRDWDYKTYANLWSQRIRGYYEAQLNVDYRTINEKTFADTLLKNMTGMSDFHEARYRELIKDYVAWIKKNKVIAKGYADPELSAVSFGGDLVWVPTRFKFMIISATDTSQTFLDNWKVSADPDSTSVTFQKGVWNVGYASIPLYTNSANEKYAHYGLYGHEYMFVNIHDKYTVSK